MFPIGHVLSRRKPLSIKRLSKHYKRLTSPAEMLEQRCMLSVSTVNVELAGLNQTVSGSQTNYAGGGAVFPVGAYGDYWNLVSNYNAGTTVPNLKTTSTASTTASFTLSTGATPGYAGQHDFVWSDYLMHNYAQSSTPLTATISGLVPYQFYDLYLYGSNTYGSNDGSSGARFTVTTGTSNGGIQSTGQGGGGANFNSYQDAPLRHEYVNHQQYVAYSNTFNYQYNSPYNGDGEKHGTGVRSDKNGNISISVSPNAASILYFNGLQITGDFTSHGTLIDIQTNGLTQHLANLGAGAVGSSQDQWNLLGGYNVAVPGTASSLLTTAGASTGVNFSFIGGAPNTYQDGNSLPSVLLDNYAAYNVTATGTLTGLTPNANYDLYLYGTNGGGGVGGTFSITAGSTLGGVQTTSAGTYNTSNFVLNRDYVAYAGTNHVTANAAGSIVFNVAVPTGEGAAVFNGLTISGSFPTPPAQTKTAANSAPTSFNSIGEGGGGYLGAPSINPANPNEMYITSDVGGTYHTLNGGTTWTNLNRYTDGSVLNTQQTGNVAQYVGFLGVNGQPISFTNNPNIQYSVNSIAYGAATALFRTTNDGVTWVPTAHNQLHDGDGTVDSQMADPSNANNVFVWDSNAGGYLQVSYDKGDDFTTIQTPNGPAQGTDRLSGIYSTVDANGYETIYVATGGSGGGLLIGTQGTPGGQYAFSWYGGSQSASVNGLNGSNTPFASGKTLFDVKGSTNSSGATTLYATFLTTAYLGNYNYQYNDPNDAYTSSYKLTIGDTQWRQCTTNGITGPIDYVTTVPNDPNTVYLAGSMNAGQPAVWKSSDGGTNVWTSVTTESLHSNGNLDTGNIGAELTQQQTPTGLGNDYSWGESGAEVTGIVISPTNPQNILFTTGNWGSVFSTNNGANTWAAVSVTNPISHTLFPNGQDELTGAAFSSTINPTVAYQPTFVDANTLLTGYGDPGMARSEDGGSTWSIPVLENAGSREYSLTVNVNTVYQFLNDTNNGTLYAAGGDLQNNHYLWTGYGATYASVAGSGGSVLYSIDHGKTWFRLAIPDGNNNPTQQTGNLPVGANFNHVVSGIALDPNNPNRMYASVASDDGVNTNGGVWVTNDLNDGVTSVWTFLGDPNLNNTANNPALDTRFASVKFVSTSGSTDYIVATTAYSQQGNGSQSGVWYGTVTWNGNSPTLVWSDRTYTGNGGMRNEIFRFTTDPNDLTGMTWYVGTSNGLYMTQDGGGTSGQDWTQKTNFSTWGAFINPWSGMMYVASTGFGGSPGLWTIKPTAGVYNFANIIHDDALPQTGITDVSFNPFKNDSKVYVGTNGSGLFVGTELDALPSGWSDGDIGGPGVAGSASYVNSTGTYTVNGSGSDIFGTSDQFNFTSKSLSGDGSIVAKVISNANVAQYAKVGIMVRDGSVANASYVFLEFERAGLFLQYRNGAGTAAGITYNSSAYNPPDWVRLVRSGNVYTAYTSPDGITWNFFASTTVPMSGSVLAGLAVSSFSNSTLNTGVFSNVALTQTYSALPSGWSDSDIGSPGVSGFAGYNSSTGTYEVEGSGSDIFGTSDQFNFARKTLVGDGSIVAKVISNAFTATYAKTGIMFRDGTAANASWVMLSFDSTGMKLEDRNGAGTSATTPYFTTSYGIPNYIRLVRASNTFTGSVSPDGSTWTTIYSTNVAMASSALAGLAVDGNSNSALDTGVFSNVTITSTAGPLPAGWTDNDVNSPGVAGSATYNSGAASYNVSGSGYGAYGGFNWANYAKTGDGSITAHLSSVSGSGVWGTGVMFRDSSGNWAAMNYTGSGYQFAWSLNNGSGWNSTGTYAAPVGYYVRMVRSGTSFSAYLSSDGITWSQMGTAQTVTISTTAAVGLAVESSTNTALETSVFDHVVIA